MRLNKLNLVNTSDHVKPEIFQSYEHHIHEIRNPLQNICSILNSMGNSNTDDNRKVKLLKLLSDHLLNYLNASLESSNKNSLTTKPCEEDFDIHEIICSIVDIYKAQCKKTVRIEYSVDTEIHNLLFGNKTGLNQILFNILGNAIKFTKQGIIAISVRLLETKNDKAIIRLIVSDTGIGVRKENIPVLFENNSQADSLIKHNYGGSGHGLAIANALVSEMGGDINVESKFGSGTKFTIDLPFKLSHDPITKAFMPDHIVQHQGLSIRVLIVDDNSLGWLQIVRSMQLAGYTVDFIDNAQQGIDRLLNTYYNIILLDLHINDTPGIKIVEELKRNKSHINYCTPIIIVSGSYFDIDANLEMNGFISASILKPFDFNKIVEAISQVLSNHNEMLNTKYLKKSGTNFSKYEFFGELIKIFSDATRKEMTKMSVALKNDNFNLIARIAHKIKPNFYAVELHTLSIRAAWIEENIEKDSDPSEKIAMFIEDSLQAIEELTRENIKVATKVKKQAL